MSHPRGLSEEEAAAWEKLSATVEPLHTLPPRPSTGSGGEGDQLIAGGGAPSGSPAVRSPSKPNVNLPTIAARRGPPPPVGELRPPRRIAPGNLDSHWDKRLKAGDIAPDLSLDLHDHGLDAAYTRLMDGMQHAIGVGARVVLLVTGKPRPVDPADRSSSRGVIRSKVLDWLAASEHGENIAAIRKAHRRHGGDGALYIVLRRQR